MGQLQADVVQLILRGRHVGLVAQSLDLRLYIPLRLRSRLSLRICLRLWSYFRFWNDLRLYWRLRFVLRLHLCLRHLYGLGQVVPVHHPQQQVFLSFNTELRELLLQAPNHLWPRSSLLADHHTTLMPRT